MNSVISSPDSTTGHLNVSNPTLDDKGVVFGTASNSAKDICADKDTPAQTTTRKTYAEYYSVGGEGQFIAVEMGPGTDWDLCATIPSTVLDADETVFVLSPGLPAMLLPRDLLRQS